MFTYLYRIYDRYNVPVTCMAIFTDTQKGYRPQQFNYDFLGTQALFRYNTYKVIDQDEDELRQSTNPFAIVILTVLLALKKGKISEEELLNLKTAFVRSLFQKQIPRNKIDAILIFLTNYVRFDNTENITKFNEEVNLITNKHATMGIREFVLQRANNEGMEKGMEIKDKENKITFVTNLLTQTDFTAQKISLVADVTVAFVEEVRASLR